MRLIEEDTCVMTKAEWIEDQRSSSPMFTRDDGVGYWATETKEDLTTDCFDRAPDWATHVAWYNK